MWDKGKCLRDWVMGRETLLSFLNIFISPIGMGWVLFLHYVLYCYSRMSRKAECCLRKRKWADWYRPIPPLIIYKKWRKTSSQGFSLSNPEPYDQHNHLFIPVKPQRNVVQLYTTLRCSFSIWEKVPIPTPSHRLFVFVGAPPYNICDFRPR